MHKLPGRRRFLKQSTTAIVSASAVLRGVHASAEQKPAQVRLAIIGCGGIMGHHVSGLVNRAETVQLAWLCDVDPAQMERLSGMVTSTFQPTPPKRTTRFEDVLDDKNVDACIIATPH